MKRPTTKDILGYALALGIASVALKIAGVSLPTFASGKFIPFTESPSSRAAIDTNTVFALDVYRQLRNQSGNVFFSPYSISTALAMVYAGARGRTETEMADAMHLSLPADEMHKAFQAIGEHLDDVQSRGRVTLLTANSAWCEKNYSVNQSFLDLTRTYYGAEIRKVDFHSDVSGACRQISDWAESKTKGKIPGAVQPSQISHNTKLVLCNAIYFKGQWKTQFKSKDTLPKPFFVTKDHTVSVPMMHLKTPVKTVELDDAPVSLLELPYIGDNISMIVILPNKFDGLADIEQQFTFDHLHEWLDALDRTSTTRISIEFPRFRMEDEADLVPILKALGMSSLFDIAHADLSGIDSKNNLFIDAAFQRAFVEVTETGTEAAATTWFAANAKSKAESFHVNHPFLFFIRDNGSGTILFLGRVVDPTK